MKYLKCTRSRQMVRATIDFKSARD
jgi:hypothetical protein